MNRISLVRLVLGLCFCFVTFSGLSAQSTKDMLAEFIDENANTYETVAQEIWELAEVGYMENESSEMLQGLLRSAGFDVEAGVAGIPTAFVASYGSGGPIIGIMGEYDALPGITQSRSAEIEAMRVVIIYSELAV